MSNEPDLPYHTKVAQSIKQVLKEFGPLTTNGVIDRMKEAGVAYMKLQDQTFTIPVEDVERVLQMNNEFVRGDANRWHLTDKAK